MSSNPANVFFSATAADQQRREQIIAINQRAVDQLVEALFDAEMAHARLLPHIFPIMRNGDLTACCAKCRSCEGCSCDDTDEIRAAREKADNLKEALESARLALAQAKAMA
jgi:hypothetical protein